MILLDIIWRWLFGPPQAERRHYVTWTSRTARLRAAIAASQDPLSAGGASARAPIQERVAFWRGVEEEAFRFLVLTP